MLKKITLITLLCMLNAYAWAANSRSTYLRIRTDYGVMIVKLYNETPKHRDNIIKLAKDGFYDGLLFHRIIENFMIQGGDPESKDASQGSQLGGGNLGYRIEAELHDSLFHKKGAVAAARDNNPEKASNATQFYIVQGEVFDDEELDRLEEMRLQGRKIPAEQREVYKTLGGVPHLDQNYTVFGEVVDGLHLIDELASVATDHFDRPSADIKMEVEVLRRGEARRLERRLRKADK